MENYKLKNVKMKNYKKRKTSKKHIKNDAGEARDPFKKMRLEKSCIILRELCIYDVLGASLGQKHWKIIKKQCFSRQNNQNVLE